jgi:ribosomal protein S14
MTDSESELVFTGSHRTNAYHLTTGCDYCPDDAGPIRRSVAEAWDTLEACRDCTGLSNTGLSHGDTPESHGDETVVISERNELFHVPDRCKHQPEKPDTLDREAAEGRGYRMCKFCDPGESAATASNHPETELSAQIRETDQCDDCGRWRKSTDPDQNGRALCLDCREQRLTRGDAP